ncbi:hypothetical protein J7I93_15965 [Bacillus sp. ISL-47]|uniref:hypothetical protein n=1 Tax=Bacillus sp. ISL-47 TaxID=2819130 RepID=UPI001BE9E180|nr:hypothetical protein [Bacillus sp. ISL-47]MBT2689684.1 hypothetical protein [Bacillus sp. ISL-47]MBT2709330.1 hypothetical protein [Pseudomonas sp. ISL-84]
MKITTSLLLIILFMQFSTLINVTVFNGEWNGINLALHTVFFILALGMTAQVKKTNES